MLIEFISLLLLHQLMGDCLLQYDRILFKRKAERFTLLEQFIFALIIGFLINGVFTLIVVAIGPFDYLLLLLFDLIFIILTLLVNKGSFNGFFYWRLYITLKYKHSINKSKYYYKKFFLFFIGIILLNLYFRSIIYDIRNVDLLSSANRALNAIRNGLSSNISDYIFNPSFPFKTHFFSIILIPFYAIAPSEWLNIVGVYLSQLQFFLFFSLVFVILYKFEPKFNFIIVFFISAAIVSFPSWFSYFLPTNFTIILFLTFLIFLFHKKIKSLFIEIFLIYFSFIIHSPSTLIIYFLPLFLTLLINWKKEPEKLINGYHEKKHKTILFIKKKKWYILFGVLILFMLSIILMITNFSFFQKAWSNYLKYTAYNKTIPTPELWRGATLGFWINLCILISFIYFFRKNKITKYKYQILFFFLLNIYLTIYLLDPEFWNDIIRTIYPEFRFIIYLDISLIILIPILFSIIKSNISIQNGAQIYIKRKIILINQYLKKYNLNLLGIYHSINFYLKTKRIRLRKIINLSNLAYFTLVISLLFYCTIKAIPNYQKRYYHKYFEEFWFDAYSYSFTFLDNIVIGYETYMFNPNTKYSHMRSHVFTYLGDLRCIDLDQVEPYYFDTKYQTNNSDYQNFLNFIFNGTKLIENDNNLPIYLRATKTVDYIFVDSYMTPNLCGFMENDTTHFKKIFQCPITNIIFLLNSLNLNAYVYIFKTKI